LLPDFQSAYRAQHSTETAVLKVLTDILTAADRGDLSMLTLLDMSAAFDIVDHPILLRRLSTSYTVSMVSSTCGSAHTSPTALSMSAVPDPGRLLYWCYVESHKGRSSGRYSSFYTQRIWCGWWSLLNCVRTCMLTTLRSTGSVDRNADTSSHAIVLWVQTLRPISHRRTVVGAFLL